MSSAPVLHQSITLSTVEANDFESLVTSPRIEAMRDSLERVGRFDPIRARERFRSTNLPECTRHIEFNGKRVGFLVVKPEADALILNHLYVRPNAQARGIGSAVLALVFEEGDSKALPVRVGALRQSDANRFYARHGFQLIEQAELDNYYVRPSKNAL